MAPGPLVPPSLNGQKRDSKRGKPRRQPPAVPTPLQSTTQGVCPIQYLCAPPVGTLPSSFIRVVVRAQGFLDLMVPDPWASPSLSSVVF